MYTIVPTILPKKCGYPQQRCRYATVGRYTRMQIKKKNWKKNSFLLHVPVEQPCYDFIGITVQTFKTKIISFFKKQIHQFGNVFFSKKKKFQLFLVPTIFPTWQAVCTLEKLLSFTVAGSSTITNDSGFTYPSCRVWSEERNVFLIGLVTFVSILFAQFYYPKGIATKFTKSE